MNLKQVMSGFKVWEINQGKTILMGWKSEKSRSQSNVPEVRVGLGQSGESEILAFVRKNQSKPALLASNGWINLDIRTINQQERKVEFDALFTEEVEEVEEVEED